ncbi:Sodium- and chloride-dependent glycine transporter 2 [Hypsibius exemplaris]|uniref:Transporter n=1 Tax=Hypsibius exemplaris TaxID=2072580 RepID=A0A1W0X6I2_HYPEX|nr:Sodium- and chloride-dependent glycine transporter 2 [Hypsibius exemplaris]
MGKKEKVVGNGSAGNIVTGKVDIDEIPDRTQWGNKYEFILACISMSVGLGNVWRFPYLAYAYGGGAFLFPYLIILFVCGKPMYFMECAFGQYHQEGPVTIWKRVAPIGKGIGYAQLVIQAMTSMYYVTIMAWAMFYFWTTLFAACLGDPVPWAGQFCDSEWAHKPSCISVHIPSNEIEQGYPLLIFTNETLDATPKVTSAQQYYDRVILMKFDKGGDTKYDLSSMGRINWLLMLNFLLSWVIMFFTLVKGIASAGKAVYITSTLPFIVLFILLGRGASLPNAVEGIKYFLVPQFDKLLNVQTWRNAAEQMFYSLSCGFGSLVMLGSYNKRKHNCYSDAMIVSVADTATSLIAGISVFSILGFMAGQLDVGVETVAQSGPGLVFVTFPEALNQMPYPHLWALIFFVMLYTLGLGSQIATLETVLTIIYDQWPMLRKKKPLVCGIACVTCFFIGIPFMMQGGIDIFDIFDSYAGGFSVLFPAVVECVIIGWVYGVTRFVNDTNNMLNMKVSVYWRSTWGLLSPLSLILILILTFAAYTPLNHGGLLPEFADGLGWGIAMVSIIQLPIWAGIAIYQAKGSTFKEKLHESCWPAEIMVPVPVGFVEGPSDVVLEELHHVAEDDALGRKSVAVSVQSEDFDVENGSAEQHSSGSGINNEAFDQKDEELR